MKKMLKVLAMMLALAIAFGCMIAFAENEEGTTEEVVVEAPQATEEPEVQEAEEEKAEAVELIVEATTEPTAEPIVEAATEPSVEPTVEATTEPTAEPIVETTAEPSTEPSAEPSEQPTEEPTEVEIDLSSLKVEIFSSLTDCVIPGETIRLTSKLTGFEGIGYSLQWQYNDGSGWKDVENATEDAYEFEATQETIQFTWRLAVEI